MKLHEILIESNEEYYNFKDAVSDELGYDMEGRDENRLMRKLFIQGMSPEEAAGVIAGGETPERFQNELSDEDLASMRKADFDYSDEPDEPEWEPDENDRAYFDRQDQENSTHYNREMGLSNAEREKNSR